ncbi:MULTISPECIES: phosphotriesterase family protein [Gordonia]|uniref:Phosphotriesterase n=2 Tax=Gordonia terrae TaxID=2055 RepID=A0AAD0KDT4_9ACTN|nr:MULTISPECIES: phosphotriesterase [Gordonia]VTR07654.1 aryldialkylphosphatase [Clostridioides difficile]ANY23892.1 phosphotriesterase [Gordonia terrae]AWO84627.1 phosphotriesterase [Gordonia terrae]MCG7632338.1 phosphotriesterase [Gordonia sp. McavH-238-E]UPW07292.1 phosphotriesterase [Gordonia terrae]
MPVIRTVLGDIAPESLGVTLCHEHLFTNPPKWAQDKDPDMVLDRVDAAIGEVTDFDSLGGGALVEMTTADYGRRGDGLLAVARATPVHIISASGYQKGIYYPESVATESVEEIAARFAADVTAGVDGTSARAGVIKFGTCRTDEIRADERKVQKAVARAHLETGAPISTHCQAGTLGDLQANGFADLGVDPDHVLIGHLDRNLDYDYLRKVAKTGVWLGFDHWTKPKYPSDDLRVDHIRRLADEGFTKIMVSGDLGRPSYQPHHGGTPGFAGLLKQIRDRLPADIAERVFVQNPRTFFAFTPREGVA